MTDPTTTNRSKSDRIARLGAGVTLLALIAGGLVLLADLGPTMTASAGEDDFPEYDESKFETTDSGLKYRIIRPGNDTKPEPSDTVNAHYAGTLDSNGREFDSSYKRGEPIDFPLNGVIKGWTEGLQLIGEGGAIQLIIPPELGYGARGAGGAIPPNATLRFNVELMQVK